MALLLGTSAKDINVVQEDWPRCAKCQMPVEHFGVVDTNNSLTLVARCHGKEEMVDLPDEMWDSFIGGQFLIGPVFGE